MTKAEQLAQLKKQASSLNLPLAQSATQLVFGEGNPEADLMFIGEAPGYYEDRQGRPFVGRAGQLLDQLINLLSLSRKDVYITNVVKHRPPGNRDPLPDEIAAYRPILEEEIKIIQPKIIATISRFAMNLFTRQGLSEGLIRGYSMLPQEQFKTLGSIRDILLNQTEINGEGYFQGILPLFDQKRPVGAIAVLISKSTVKKNTIELIRLLGLVFGGTLLLIIPLVFIFSNSLSNRVNSNFHSLVRYFSCFFNHL